MVILKKLIAILLSLLMAACVLSCMREDTPDVGALETEPELSGSIPVMLPDTKTEVSPSVEAPGEVTETDIIATLIDGMTLRKQISQLFILSVPGGVTAPTAELEEYIRSTNAGGYVLFAGNISSIEGTRLLTDAICASSQTAPFIAIDEEGGIVSRLYSAGLPEYERKPSAASIGESGDTQYAYDTALSIGAVLCEIGVNLDFAPVADTLVNPHNTAIGSRAFGSDPMLVSDMVSAFMHGLTDAGVMSAVKHFPGHGATDGDSHDGFVSFEADEQRLWDTEYVPFAAAIESGAPFVMMGHITVTGADDSGLPATFSEYFVTDVLRGALGFDGVVITDAMNMGAIADNYDAGEAACMAIRAGVDIILVPEDFDAAIDGILTAIELGDLSEARIRESVERVLRAKLDAGFPLEQGVA